MNKERLLKLAKHLRSGMLGHDKFDFSYFHVVRTCGSVGCAIGEMPFVWPDVFEFSRGVQFKDPEMKTQNFSTAMFWFDISSDETYWLFSPDIPDICTYQVDTLPRTATAIDVADRIERFVQDPKPNIYKEKHNESQRIPSNSCCSCVESES